MTLDWSALSPSKVVLGSTVEIKIWGSINTPNVLTWKPYGATVAPTGTSKANVTFNSIGNIQVKAKLTNPCVSESGSVNKIVLEIENNR